MKIFNKINIISIVTLIAFVLSSGSLSAGQSDSKQINEKISNNNSLNLQKTVDFKEKSPLLAAGISFGALGAGIAATVVGGYAWDPAVFAGLGIIALGPYGGHIYSESYGRGALFTAARLAGVTMMTVGLLSYDEAYSANEAAIPLMVAGVIITGASSIWSTIDAGYSAHRHNKRKRQMALAPVVAPGGSDGTSIGAQFSIDF